MKSVNRTTMKRQRKQTVQDRGPVESSPSSAPENPPAPRKKRRLRKGLRITLIALGVAFVLLLVAAQLTSTSGFCKSCHYMKPFYKSWQESSHRDIPCSTCHYPPGLRSKIRAKLEGLVMVGRYWTKLYLKSKPWAEISDASCLKPGCHDRRLLEGEVRFNKVAFDHKVHFTDLKRGKRLRCTSCHSQIVQGKHITVTESSCFICHFKAGPDGGRGADCTLCHKKAQLVAAKTSRYDHSRVFDNGFSCDKCHAHTVSGDGAVPRENCYKCHFEQDRLNRYDDTSLMHAKHIAENKIECAQCHLEIQHRISRDISTIADCQTCHTNLHAAQKILYTGQGGKGGARPRPNVMLERGLSCKACHIFHEEMGSSRLRGDTRVSREEACESCHGRGFGRVMKDWEATAESGLAEIRRVYARARTETASSPRAKAFLEEAAYNIDVVEQGKSVHNVSYAQELLLAAFLRIQEALKAAGSDYAPSPSAFQRAEIPVACANCHAGVEDATSEIYGLKFNHRPHLVGRGMTCGDCHSNARRHGELTASKSSCTACHHREVKRDCADCHALQKTVYAGGRLAGLNVPADMMAEAGVNCSDCHLDPDGNVIRSTAGQCLACHEGGYKALFDEWRSGTLSLLGELEKVLSEKARVALSPADKAVLEAVSGALLRLKTDGSGGIHNSVFIQETLRGLIERAKSLAPRSIQ